MSEPSRDERQILAEVQAALAIVSRHRPAAALFRLTCDRAGTVRLILERVEGVPLAALVDDRGSERSEPNGGLT